MVRPPTEEDDREAMTRLKVAVVALVGASAGLVALSGGGSAVQIAAAVLGGVAVGMALLAYLVRIS